MNNQNDRIAEAADRPQIVYLIVILICALVIRLYGLSDASLWLDETATIYISELPMSTLWLSAYDPTPPVFYTIEKVALLMGDSACVLRFPSVIFGVLTVYFVYRAALEAAGQKAALAASLFIAFSSGNIEYSQEARAYALLGLCISVAFLGLVRLNSYLEDTRTDLTAGNFLKHGGALYLLFTLAALYTHNTAVFFILAAQVYFIWMWLYRTGRSLNLAVLWIVTNAIVFILWTPWLAASMDTLTSGQTFTWLQHASPDQAIKTLRNVHGFRDIKAGQPLLDLFVVAMMAAGLHALKKKPGLLVLSLAALTASSLVIWLFGFYKPVFMYRTILWGTLITAFLLGAGTAQFTPRYSYAIIFLLVLLGMKNTYSYFESNGAEEENWKDAAHYLDAAGQASDTYIFCADYVIKPYVYYANNLADNSRLFGWVNRTDSVKRAELRATDNMTGRVTWTDDIVSIPEALSGEQLWLVSAHNNYREIDHALLIIRKIREAGYEPADYKQFLNIKIYGFRKTAR